ncbi:unnamed protein product [Polarella glacialis]|nr:unnamed protein product [Polarella glacialis]
MLARMTLLLPLLLLLCGQVFAENADFRVQFDVVTTDGPGVFVIKVRRDWSPNGADRFKELVESGFYDDTRFFRVIPSFMVQFGISGNPAVSTEWRSKTIEDDAQFPGISNSPGMVSFAKTGAPNSRTTQLFINYANNGNLDGMGFTPFGEVESGMDIVKKIYPCQERPQQGRIQSEGNAYLDAEFKDLSKIVSAKVLTG